MVIPDKGADNKIICKPIYIFEGPTKALILPNGNLWNAQINT